MKLPYIFQKPIITETSLKLAQHGQYTFAVVKSATKSQIKTAAETYFKVKVTGVRTLTRMAKTKRAGKLRRPVKAANTKKAIITVKSGQTIDLFDAQKD
jgi:large subunit ribosomal protein L23